MKVVVDIETVPLHSSLLATYPLDKRNPPANYKSEEAIAKWREADRKDWADGLVKESSLNPRLGRVLCIGMKSGESPAICAMAETEDKERDVLVAFWEEVARTDGEVVTWNGAWDLRFILIRSLIHGIEFTEYVSGHNVRNWFRKFSVFPHTDCKAVLTNWEPPRSGEGLDEWCRTFGIDGKSEGISGKDVFPMYTNGEFDAIIKYNLADVEATYAIYQKAVSIMTAP